MQTTDIGFIGGGNMARSLIGGLIADGADPGHLWVSDPDTETVEDIRQRFGIQSCDSNTALADSVDVLVLAVKPQNVRSVCEEISAAVSERAPLLISIAAGVRVAALSRWLGADVAIVRTMPNTPALVQSGMTALYANDEVSEIQHSVAESILRAVGVTVWIDDEAQMDAVTALSGSGPAYFFLLLEALEHAGTRLGLDARVAQLLTLQTGFGAARLALESEDDAAVLRQRVTSPGGTTESAIRVLQDAGFEALFDEALQAACKRATELADMMEES
jgi:pyrroline-5-carboxylate reductase